VIWALGKPEGADLRGKAMIRIVLPKFKTECAKVFAAAADIIEAIIAEEGIGTVISFAPAPAAN
jgi:hypothetical protein